MYDGWIKLHRRIYDNPIVWRSADPYDRRSAWIDLLLLVNHEPRDIMINNHLVHIERGQTWTSYRQLAERWHWSINKVRRYTECLARANMLTLKAHTDGTALTVVNYGLYQGGRHTDEYADDTPTIHPRIHQRTTNKNIKNDKNDNKHIKRENRAESETVFLTLWDAYPEKKGKSRVSDKDKRKLAEIGVEQGLRAITRYKHEVEHSGYLHYQHGSTFFHSGIHDYLDDSYTPTTEKKVEAIQRKNSADINEGRGMPYYKEFDNTSPQIGTDSPFKDGAAVEMIRRKRKGVKGGNR